MRICFSFELRCEFLLHSSCVVVDFLLPVFFHQGMNDQPIFGAALRTMARGYSPNFVNWMTDNKLKLAKERLPFFFKFEGEQAENGLEKKLEDVKLKMSNDEIVDLVEMQPFSVFSWLLSKEKLAEAGAITEKLFRETSYVPEAKALEDISPDTPLNKKKRVSKASTPLAAAALDNVANLFV